MIDTVAGADAQRLLIVGPLPPPIGGSPVTAQAMVEELGRYPDIGVAVINTSPLRDVRKELRGFHLEKVRRMVFILSRYVRDARRCDAVLVFANDVFAFILVPALLLLARCYRKRFYIKPVGAGLDLYLAAKSNWARRHLLWVLRAADGILAQTQVLQKSLIRMGCARTYYLPGCRPRDAIRRSQRANSRELRLIDLAHITRLKGPLVLLEALQILNRDSGARVSCDFYGPVHDELREEFHAMVEATPNVRYCGMAEPGSGPRLIAGYDALVLPTRFDSEGHPGVLIEAMHAGVPVISTLIRTLPELVTHGENGLLVPAGDSHALAEAIRQLALDPALRERMGEANYRKGQEFSAEVVVRQMLEIVFPDTRFILESSPA